MLTTRLLSITALATSLALPAAAQDLQPHRAVYSVTMLEKGKSAGGPPGTYAFELKQTCEGYVINQRMRLEVGDLQVQVYEQIAGQWLVPTTAAPAFSIATACRVSLIPPDALTSALPCTALTRSFTSSGEHEPGPKPVHVLT